jgi:GNAT superfamily N-acetyltransferase
LLREVDVLVRSAAKEDHPPDEVVIIAELGDETIGEAKIERVSRGIYFVSVFVVPEHRRKKVGTMLWRAAEQYVVARGGEPRAKVNPDSLGAINFLVTACGMVKC